jgi:hypothetical protein
VIWLWIVTGVIAVYPAVRAIQAARQVTMEEIKSLFRDMWKLFKTNPLIWHPIGYIAWRVTHSKAVRKAHVERVLADGR